ncbi:MAG TPA: nitrite transporter NirC, partial [Nitrospira sp.]|nr:nitrite transporter NirC [Nitrospira sp.]
MHTADHERIAGVAAKKWMFLEQAPGGYFILSSLAGIYLGFGIALIFSLGGPLAAAGSPVVKLVMGVSFGIA